ncbi:glutathione S-transferase family protein [Pelagibacterium montanilacus]|uniref:glutathione S-transferase family protein n=1 Tax=Pelagibacterium montanilacus TaxID=2185280 RepID=UPI000F8F7FA1|nr:glutathione S-transferase family protein [Pelagibacterium montanilacus]
MKLYMHPASITSRPVRLFIAEKGLAVDEQIVDLFTGEHHQEPFLAINQSRLVPVLEDGDVRLTESATILRYLAEKNGLAEYPTDLVAKAKVNEVMDWVNSNFYRDWGYNLCYPQLFPHHKRPTDEGHRVAVEWGRDKSHFWMQVLNDKWLGDGRTYLTGSEITVADYFTASIVALGHAIRFDFSAYPNVEAWLGRMKALPHWAAVSEQLEGFNASLEGQKFVA